MDIGVPELLIIAVIIVLLFGVGRIGKVGGELGKGIREFRAAVKDEDSTDATKKDISAVSAPAVTATATDQSKLTV
jgi:sec-independent protein translocase protein TatA